MKARGELLLYRLSWTFDMMMSPTWRNLNDSFESWAYRSGCLRQIQELEALDLIESRAEAGLGKRRVFRLTELGRLAALGGRDPEVAWSRPWDGQWRMVMFDVPEAARDAREMLRAALRKLHFGCLQKSVWISPGSLAEVADEMKRLKADAASLVLMEGRSWGGETAGDLVGSAWDFKGINRSWERLRRHLATVPGKRGRACAEELVDWSAEELGLWKACMSLDPLLPKVLHPSIYHGPGTWKLRRKVFTNLGRQLVGDVRLSGRSSD